MSIQRDRPSDTDAAHATCESSSSPPDVRTAALVQRKIQRRALQRRANAAGEAQDEAAVHRTAEEGVSGGGSPLPFGDRIQAAFGRHDVSQVRAHTDGTAARAAESIGASAYATGQHVAFKGAPDLHTAAHEAAHVVQQRAGVHLKGGVGEEGDAYERHADTVADAVVAGKSAEHLLDGITGASGSKGVQKKNLSQHGLDGGLAQVGTADLVGYTKPGQVYEEKLGATPATRGEALAKAGELSAVIGQRIDDSKKGWTPDSAAFNDPKVGTLDPFLYKATLKFGANENLQDLSITFQHAKAKTGYVIGIEDSSNPATAGGATMYDKKDGKKRPTDKFSHEHDVAVGGNLIEQTEGGDEHNLDAYTKIAGEGARFLCVRQHTAHLQNDSLFFTAHEGHPTKVVGIAFQELWKKWNQAFKKKYDVPDIDVATSIRSGKLVDVALVIDKGSLSAKDYDLDAQASYVPAPAEAKQQ